jgi:hypothetical protein
MPSEPDWSKQISNSSVCTWFYALAIINAIFAVAGIGMALFSGKIRTSVMVSLVLSSIIGFTNMWFLFLVCKRGINEAQTS